MIRLKRNKYFHLIIKWSSFILLFALAGQATAESVYVTDKLYLGIYRTADDKDEQLKVVPSGTRLEILESAGQYTQVITEDGVKGWVKAHFLVVEAPAVVRIKEYEDLLNGSELLQKELEKLRAQNGQLSTKINELTEKLTDKTGELDQLDQSSSNLQQDKPASVSIDTPVLPVATEKASPQETPESRWFDSLGDNPLYQSAALLLMLLIIGLSIYGGRKSLEWKIRKLHGGYKTW